MTPPARNRHQLLLYRDDAEFGDAVGPFLRRSLEDGRRNLVAVSPQKGAIVREALGRDDADLGIIDPARLYERLGPMFHELAAFLADDSGRPATIVAEAPLPDMRPAVRDAYLRFEAAANQLYAAYGTAAMCAYDARRTPTQVLHDARCVHPEVVEAGQLEESRVFMDPRHFVRRGIGNHASPDSRRTVTLEDPSDLTAVRSAIREIAGAANGWDRPTEWEELDGFLFAVHEVARNALEHGAPPRDVAISVDGGDLVCRVRDSGPGMRNPVQAYLPPEATGAPGRGLWLATSFCDVFGVSTSEQGSQFEMRRALLTLRGGAGA